MRDRCADLCARGLLHWLLTAPSSSALENQHKKNAPHSPPPGQAIPKRLAKDWAPALRFADEAWKLTHHQVRFEGWYMTHWCGMVFFRFENFNVAWSLMACVAAAPRRLRLGRGIYL